MCVCVWGGVVTADSPPSRCRATRRHQSESEPARLAGMASVAGPAVRRRRGGRFRHRRVNKFRPNVAASESFRPHVAEGDVPGVPRVALRAGAGDGAGFGGWGSGASRGQCIRQGGQAKPTATVYGIERATTGLAGGS